MTPQCNKQAGVSKTASMRAERSRPKPDWQTCGLRYGEVGALHTGLLPGLAADTRARIRRLVSLTLRNGMVVREQIATMR